MRLGAFSLSISNIFPYKIIYIVESDNVIILALIHGKKSPDPIENRIERG